MAQRKQPREVKRRGVIERLFGATVGRAWSMSMWALYAVIGSILIEWVGIVFWWDLDHSQLVLNKEIEYLSDFNKNFFLNIYPGDLAAQLASYTRDFMTWSGIGGLAYSAANSSSSVMNVIGSLLQSMINVFFIFSVRLAMCISSISGFILVSLLAGMDGLTEREIRKSCGGKESATIYHHAKRWVGPSMILAFVLYLTIPISIHPTVIFLPAMFITGLAIFITASTFKKFL
ncbi:TIGR03747 family integrating conjugative element membrane protein [Marinagarivorans cellulosilyticus]|uniref:Integrating conjugative element membrane protein n=1 Tax=Marinagarivorans cellulosilyticus TaxID=2721545 RepID=A0AAN1WHM1_9GAMM|nr:TIGR03747 family integrating conjugative element membrane protein [Marinagarivorans cellulosilyticus]BCD97768.1 hypothetical protein MARGE09_P1969 [Marinagarivorans cellulosilyticus]